MNLKAKLYAQDNPTITDDGIHQIIDDTNTIFNIIGLNTQIEPSSIIRHNETTCYDFPLDNYDFKLCIGYGIGGYGWNTVNWEYEFLSKGDQYKNPQAHEVIHHLGVKDLYWYKILEDPKYPASADLQKDLFYYSYHTYSYLIDSNKYVANGNLYRIEHFGKDSILYPIKRRPLSIVYHTNEPNTTFKTFKSNRDYSKFTSTINLNAPIAISTTDSEGKLKLNLNNIIGFNELDLLYVTSSKKSFWITGMELDTYVDFHNENYTPIEIHIPKQPDPTPTPTPTPIHKITFNSNPPNANIKRI